MSKLMISVQQQFCAECSLALRRFIGGMDGVNSVDVEQGKIAIDYDEREMAEEKLRTIARDSIERLGYKVED